MNVFDGVSHSEGDESVELGEVGGYALVWPLLQREELADGGDEACGVLHLELGLEDVKGSFGCIGVLNG